MNEVSQSTATKNVKTSQKKKMKSGGFQVMGLSRPVLNGILRKGYKIPTPIQRKVIPVILEGKDVVAMARTGSGKTAAFLIPLFEKLQVHSSNIGARGLILSPTRELAMQTLTFAKELGKFTNIKAAVILGGDSFNEQFMAMHNNPDVIIATPGRFTHICVEMNLKLESVEYVVFDEADRLFEMGFYEQLNEIMRRLPANRQTLLFSATLPKMLVEFAQAGLTDPVLTRLDVESKIPKTLKQTYFNVTPEDKIPFLLHLVDRVIPKDEQTVIFVPTKSHVEYIHQLLNDCGIPNTYLYSTLDPSARKINIAKFRAKKISYLIVTDIAARGIDLPLLNNVINFNFPSRPKLFIHRVGRVARAGKSGNSYSLVSIDEFPYLLDLHMFLDVELRYAPTNFSSKEIEDWHHTYGKIPQNIIDDNRDYILNRHYINSELVFAIKSMEMAQLKYLKTRPLAAKKSVRRSKEIALQQEVGFHPLLLSDSDFETEKEKLSLLDKLKNVRPKSTIFEVKNNSTPDFINEIRAHDHYIINKFKKNLLEKKLLEQKKLVTQDENEEEEKEEQLVFPGDVSLTKSSSSSESHGYFLPYFSSDMHEETGYSVKSSFERESAKVSLDLAVDEETKLKSKPLSKWDRTKKKFVNEMTTKKVKTESGVWISASYKSDYYSKWKDRMNKHDEDVNDAFSSSEGLLSFASENQNRKRKAEGFVTLNTKEGKSKHPLLKGVATVKGPRAGIKPLEQRQKEERKKKYIRKRIKEQTLKNKQKKGNKKKITYHNPWNPSMGPRRSFPR